MNPRNEFALTTSSRANPVVTPTFLVKAILAAGLHEACNTRAAALIAQYEANRNASQNLPVSIVQVAARMMACATLTV